MAEATQVDLFLDQLVDAPIKDERALMEFPFFSLQKQPRREPLVYDDGTVRIAVEAGARGIATIWDKDVLIYIASIINDRIERGAPVEPTIQFPAYDFLKVTGRGTGKRAYDLFLSAMDRLLGTTITTTIEAGGERERRGFNWIAGYRVVERVNSAGDKVMAGVEVQLNRWMYNSIVKDRRVLTINREYFRLSKGLERRLYELARKHVGNQPEWYIGLARLAEKCGTVDTIRKFKVRLAEIIAEGTIPDYKLEMVPAGFGNTPFRSKDGQPMVRFAPLVNPVADRQHDRRPTRTMTAKIPVIIEADEVAGDGIPRITINAYQEAQRLFPGYDVDWLEQRWVEWSSTRSGGVKDADKAFLSWCRTYTSNNPLV